VNALRTGLRLFVVFGGVAVLSASLMGLSRDPYGPLRYFTTIAGLILVCFPLSVWVRERRPSTARHYVERGLGFAFAAVGGLTFLGALAYLFSISSVPPEEPGHGLAILHIVAISTILASLGAIMPLLAVAVDPRAWQAYEVSWANRCLWVGSPFITLSVPLLPGIPFVLLMLLLHLAAA
jgi:hypothetical protein